MSDERCPRCGGSGFDVHVVDAWCDNCDSATLADSLSDVCEACGSIYDHRHEGALAYFEPRDRLPTEVEELAHAETWGEGAGWMVRFTDISKHPDPFVIAGLVQWGAVDLSAKELRRAWEGDVELGAQVQSYPIAPDGRPVGWPTVKEE